MTPSRRLAAILVADVVGYSRLMEADEAGTLAALKERRKTILEPMVKEHGGRIVKVMGDGVLVEFASAVKAVEAASKLQEKFAAANDGVNEDRRILLRIGINLGDVIGEGTDIYGDGVNIAARLEALAEPGGLCISAKVMDEIAGKVAAHFEGIGERQLKNIAKPVHAYRNGEQRQPPLQTRRDRRATIAVLPFANLSGDPEQEYFADGLTEDVITELSRFSSLTVIARNSCFQWRKRPDDVKKIGQSLGAQYLVEGSVRHLGASLRITAQLVEAETGHHLWAERYDRPQEQFFDIQDDVVRAIVTTTEHRVIETAAEVIARKPPNSWAAYDHYLRGRKYLAHYHSYGDAEEQLRRAIAIDPTMAEAHAGLAHATMGRYWQAFDPNVIEEVRSHARNALSIDPGLSDAHVAISLVYAFTDDLDRAIASAERALTLNPNNVIAAADHAQWLVFGGRCEEALAELEGVLERDPIPPSSYWDTKGTALFQLKRYREAIDAYYMVNDREPWQLAYIAASLAHLGEIDNARRLTAEVLKYSASMSITRILQIDPYQTEAARQNLADGLRKAGLPE